MREKNSLHDDAIILPSLLRLPQALHLLFAEQLETASSISESRRSSKEKQPTPFAALACNALRRLFSSAVDRLSHAEANIDRGTHFLVGSGMTDRGRLDDESIAVTVDETEDKGSHRSVLISWNMFPPPLLLPLAVDDPPPPPWLDWTVVLACIVA
jgi:hypothetical protein